MLTRAKPIYIDKIKKLLSKYPNMLNMQNHDGWSPLMLAACNSNNHSTFETVKLLLDYPGIGLEVRTINGNTALSIAVKYSGSLSSIQTVQLLLDRSANINNINAFGETALHMGILAMVRDIQHCSVQAIELLIQSKINRPAGWLDNKNHDGDTALMLIARSSSSKWFDQILIKLITHGADLNAKNNKGFTPLMVSALGIGKGSSVNSVLTLVNAGADCNLKNINGVTALLCAIQSRNVNVIRILINAGADLLAVYKNKKPFDFADDDLKRVMKDMIFHRILKLILNTDQDLECMICLDSSKINAELPCGHKFHNKCINEWLGTKNTCPVCRQEFF